MEYNALLVFLQNYPLQKTFKQQLNKLSSSPALLSLWYSEKKREAHECVYDVIWEPKLPL